MGDRLDLGGVIGNAMERGATQQNGVELLLQMRNGERRSIVQANGNEGWMVGEPVVLVTTGGRTRVTRAPATTTRCSRSRESAGQCEGLASR